ncbi:MAG: hypothetical protein IKX25_09310 [Bacteroidales bacterium]|nr:hypothetical protein [Bacteroidales bacterium]
MKKLFKYASVALAAVMAISTTSCSDDSHEYVPATPESGDQVYFSTETATSYNAKATENKISIPIYRIRTDASASVPITVTDEKGNFSGPSTVNFDAGKNEANIDLTYDFEKVGYDNYSTIILSIADAAYTTAYGISSLTVKAGIPSPWTSLGTGKFKESWWAGRTYDKEIQQNDNDPQTFRVVDPFSDKGNYVDGADYFEFRIYKAGETLLGQVLENDVVFYEDCAMTYYDYYDAVINIDFPGYFTSAKTQDFWTHNRVVYQEDGSIAYVQIAPFFYMDGVGGWNKSQAEDIIVISFPGYSPKDYDSEITYGGMLTTSDGNFAKADVTLGADIASAKVAVIPDGEALYTVEDDILSGAVESVDASDGGSVYVPFPYENSGRYDLVLIGYDEEGAEVYATYVTFSFTAGGGEKWNKIGSGTFFYQNFFEGEDPGLEIFQSDANPTRYKITHALYDVDFCFTLSSSGTVLLVDDQTTGYVGDYGEVFVDDCQDYYGSENTYGASYFDEEKGVYYFATKYYVPGVGGYTPQGYESFTLDAAAEAATRRARTTLKVSESISNIPVQKFRHDQKLDQTIIRW